MRRIRVGVLADFPELKPVVVLAEGRPIVIVTMEGRPYAIDNICPHSEGALGDGEMVDGLLVCPVHQYPFDPRTGATPIHPTLRAPTYPTIVEGEEIFVEIPG